MSYFNFLGLGGKNLLHQGLGSTTGAGNGIDYGLCESGEE